MEVSSWRNKCPEVAKDGQKDTCATENQRKRDARHDMLPARSRGGLLARRRAMGNLQDARCVLRKGGVMMPFDMQGWSEVWSALLPLAAPLAVWAWFLADLGEDENAGA